MSIGKLAYVVISAISSSSLNNEFNELKIADTAA